MFPERPHLAVKVPDAESQLISQVATFVSTLRNEDLEKKPGIAETVDWLRALFLAGIGSYLTTLNLSRAR